MTIRPGAEWGSPIERPEDLIVAVSDAELATLVATDRDRPLGVSAGDLHQSVGAPPPRQDMRRLPVDALRVELDDDEMLAVAHVVARRSWWRGQIVAVLNCDHIGRWNVALRAHPNDGRFDVVEVSASMSLRDRWEARHRLPRGTHLPHPDVAATIATQRAWEFADPTPVWVDGVERRRCRRLAVTIVPDHFAICV